MKNFWYLVHDGLMVAKFNSLGDAKEALVKSKFTHVEIWEIKKLYKKETIDKIVEVKD